jgi:type I restriction enzyme M protein
MSEDSRGLGERIFSSIDIIRGTVSPVKYKEYLIPLIYYKRVSDESARIDASLNKNESETEELEPLPYVEQRYRWSVICKPSSDLSQHLSEALGEIPVHDVVEPVTADTDFEILQEDDVLQKLVEYIGEIQLDFGSTPPEEFGPIFDNFLTRMYQIEGRGGGGFITPRRIVQLAVQLTDNLAESTSVHDPTVGSGGFLIQAADRLGDDTGLHHIEQRVAGQDINPVVAGIARINLEMHGVDGDIAAGDSLSAPQFTANGELERFDVVLSDFPISSDWKKSELEDKPYDRFPKMKLPRENRADYAFILHALACLKTVQQDGRGGEAALIVPEGIFFRQFEKSYRKHLVENDYIEQIVHLPENLQQHHSLETAILKLNTDKSAEREGEIRFVDARGEAFYENKNDTTRLTPRGVNEAIAAANDWDSNSEIARTVPHDRIRATDFSLNLAEYLPASDDPARYRFIQQARSQSKEENKRKNIESNEPSFAQRLSDLITASDNAVYVLGKYGGATEAELLDVRNELRDKGYEAYIDRDLEDFPTQDLSGSVTTTMRLAKFCVMVDREASGHLNEYQLAQLNRTVLARLTPEDGGSSRMIGTAEMIDVNYIEEFEFEIRPQERLSEAVDWAEGMVSKRRREYTEMYDWRER